MAKKQTADNITPNILELYYKLNQLPSAQHKTGLAGLVFLVRTMAERKMEPLPEITQEDDDIWKILFTRESFQALFDELYDAEKIEVESATKWSGMEAIDSRERTTEKDGKQKVEKVFVYEITVPKGTALKGVLPDGKEGEKKLKLWRDMLWGTYRGKPAARGVYLERAQGAPCSFTENTWNALLKKRGGTEALAGSLLLGAEGYNAEGVQLKGTFEENFLLHFAHMACPLFVTRTFAVKRGKKENSATYSVEWNEGGYVLVMPEIIDINKYVRKYKDWLGKASPEQKHHRPLTSLIDLPEESGLEFLSAISERRLQTQDRTFFDTIEGVEYYHMVKKGNAVNVLTSAYIPLSKSTLNEYNHLVAPTGSKRPLNFLYKTFCIRNLLNGIPWHTGMQSIFEQYPTEFFIWSREGSPRNAPFFGHDIRRKFAEIAETIMYLSEEENMETNSAGTPAANQDDRLAAKTRSIVRRFVISELKDRVKKELLNGKTHLERTKNDGDAHYSQTYQDAVEKICKGAFLALRGRKGADIAEFFTGTLCAHPQVLKSSSKNEEDDDYILVAKSLVDPEEREKIKLFAMLALSACSYIYIKDEQQQTETEQTRN